MTTPASASPIFLRLRDVAARVAMPRSSVYALMKAGQFPLRVNLGPKRARWLESEVTAWIVERAAERRPLLRDSRGIFQ